MPELKTLRYELLDVRVDDGQLHLHYRVRDQTLGRRLRQAAAYIMQGLAYCGTAYGAPPQHWYRAASLHEEIKR